ncbi:MAG TPA: hypothetical protein VMB76_17085 [Casimicrobiaceae bacterium]|jgi:hypothetical protein|nr:hypothetical protein [Casimicrobiaceae bacterium]
MRISPRRLLAWLFIAVLALAGAAAEVLPTLGAGVASAVSLCAPDKPAQSKERIRDFAVVHAPRCGVA